MDFDESHSMMSPGKRRCQVPKSASWLLGSLGLWGKKWYLCSWLGLEIVPSGSVLCLLCQTLGWSTWGCLGTQWAPPQALPVGIATAVGVLGPKREAWGTLESRRRTSCHCNDGFFKSVEFTLTAWVFLLKHSLCRDGGVFYGTGQGQVEPGTKPLSFLLRLATAHTTNPSAGIWPGSCPGEVPSSPEDKCVSWPCLFPCPRHHPYHKLELSINSHRALQNSKASEKF